MHVCRSVVGEVVSQLLAAWGECSPGVAEDAGHAVPALEAMAAILQSLKLVLERLSTSTKPAGTFRLECRCRTDLMNERLVLPGLHLQARCKH